MPLTTKTVTVKIAICDWPRCHAEVKGDPVSLSKEGISGKPYLCRAHLDKVNGTLDPLLSTAPGKRRTARAAGASASARVRPALPEGSTTINFPKPPHMRTRASSRPKGAPPPPANGSIDLTDGSPNGLKVPSSSEVRAWAQAQGKKIGARGRIPPELVKEYEEAIAK